MSRQEKRTVTNSKQHRRDQLGIIANILENTLQSQGLLKTQIMYRANLSFWQLNEYLKFLLETDLITQTNVEGREVYLITAKGLGFLRRHRELKKMLDNHENYKIPA